MSLVNNMLRDLDQRRQESDSSGGGVKLLPASEFVSEESRSFLPYLLLGLALLFAALVYYWFTVNQESVEQQLDLQVRSPTSNRLVDSEQLIRDIEESILVNEAALQREQAIVEAAAESNVHSLASLVESRVTTAQPAENLMADSAALPTQSNQVIINTEPAAVAASLALLRSSPAESVKEAPEFTNEQLDTIAVQEALRLISNGNTEGANETLEQFIASNRYAHQSRETYAKLLMSRGSLEEANTLINAGIALTPNHSGFKKVKARLLMRVGEIGEAVSLLMSRAPDMAQDSEYYDLLASAQLMSRDFSGAVISYRGLVQHDQTQGKWWFGFAAAHDQLGNSEEARQAYSQAIQYSNLSANLRRRSQERLGALSLQ
jgi:MSHA biogenesis protein MshN